MKILASVSWDPEVQFEQSSLINIVLSLENGEVQRFEGQLKNPEQVLVYLRGLYLLSTENIDRKGREFVGKIVEDKVGNRIYEIRVNFSEEKVRTTAAKIQKRHYIAPRDEWVTDEEEGKFLGSSGDTWNIRLCDYPQGGFVETLRQTIYLMFLI